jgi:Spy/CpxP family protein refolding chaperone
MLPIMQRGLVGLALVGTLATGAMAQASVSDSPTAAAPTITQHRQGPWQQLHLSVDQRQQIRHIMDGFRTERQADKTAFEAQAKLVLNQDQVARWGLIKADHPMHPRDQQVGSQPHRRMAARHHGFGMDRLARELHMSPEQKAQLQAYRESEGPKMRAERQAMAQQIRGVLTPAQQSQLDQMRHPHPAQNPA